MKAEPVMDVQAVADALAETVSWYRDVHHARFPDPIRRAA